MVPAAAPPVTALRAHTQPRELLQPGPSPSPLQLCHGSCTMPSASRFVHAPKSQKCLFPPLQRNCIYWTRTMTRLGMSSYGRFWDMINKTLHMFHSYVGSNWCRCGAVPDSSHTRNNPVVDKCLSLPLVDICSLLKCTLGHTSAPSLPPGAPPGAVALSFANVFFFLGLGTQQASSKVSRQLPWSTERISLHGKAVG